MHRASIVGAGIVAAALAASAGPALARVRTEGAAVAGPTVGPKPPASARVVESGNTRPGGPRIVWTLKSTAIESGKPIPKRHTADGEDLSPPLAWPDPPAGTREFALVVDDPDAPSPEPWVHWVLYRLPGGLRALTEGIPPARSVTNPAGALQGKNSWGSVGWRGPSPPRGHGVHHYHFKLYALDILLADKGGLSKTELLAAMKGHVLAEAEIVGTYQR